MKRNTPVISGLIWVVVLSGCEVGAVLSDSPSDPGNEAPGDVTPPPSTPPLTPSLVYNDFTLGVVGEALTITPTLMESSPGATCALSDSAVALGFSIDDSCVIRGTLAAPLGLSELRATLVQGDLSVAATTNVAVRPADAQSSNGLIARVSGAGVTPNALSATAAALNATTDLSIELWMRGSAHNYGGCLVCRDLPSADSANQGKRSFQLGVRANAFYFNFYGANNGGHQDVGAYVNNAWNHVVLVYKSASSIAFYVNGVKVSHVPISGVLATAGLVAPKIGSNGHGELPFTGEISQVSLYDRALTPADVSAHCRASASSHTGATCPTLELNLSASTAAVKVGSTISLAATGGVPSYQYLVVSGGGSVDSTTGIYTAPMGPATSVVRVTDARGATKDLNLSVVANPNACPVGQFRVTLLTPDQGLIATYCNAANENILDRAEELMIDLPYSSRAGASPTEAARLVMGTVDNSDQSYLDIDQLADGYILTDVAYPTSDLILRTHAEEELF